MIYSIHTTLCFYAYSVLLYISTFMVAFIVWKCGAQWQILYKLVKSVYQFTFFSQMTVLTLYTQLSIYETHTQLNLMHCNKTVLQQMQIMVMVELYCIIQSVSVLKPTPIWSGCIRLPQFKLHVCLINCQVSMQSWQRQ